MNRALVFLALLLASGVAARTQPIARPTAANGTVPTSGHRADELAPPGRSAAGLLSLIKRTGIQAIGQTLPIMAPYTASMLNTRRDILRIQVGDCGPDREFQMQPGMRGVTDATTAGVLGCVTTPAGLSKSQPTWPDMGVAGIANTDNAAKAAVGSFGMGGAGVDGAVIQAFNGVVSNTPTGALASSGHGHNVLSLNTIEADMNVFALASGAAPSGGQWQGISSYISGTIQPVNSTKIDAFAAISANMPVNGVPSPQWVNAFASHDAMAQVALYAGTFSYGVPSNSQSISFHMGATGAVPLTDAIYGQSDGSLIITTMGAGPTRGSAGIGPDGTLYSNAKPVIGYVPASGYTHVVDPGNGDAIVLTPGAAVYNETTHTFRSSSGSTRYATIGGTGVVSGSTALNGATLSVQNAAATCTHTATTASETVSCSSDARLKANIRDAADALGWLDGFRIRTFETRSDGTSHVGVIAQELRDEHPELVHVLEGESGDVLAAEQPDPWKTLKALQEVYRLVKLLLVWSVLVTGICMVLGFRAVHTHRIAKQRAGC